MAIKPVPNTHRKLRDLGSTFGIHGYQWLPRPGDYLASPADHSGTLLLLQGRAWLTPIYLTRTLGELDAGAGAAIDVTVAGTAGSVCRLGLYNSDSINEPMGPRTVARDWGTVATTTTGRKSISLPDVDIPPGFYWLAVVGQGAPATQPTLRANVASPMLAGLTGSAGENYGGLRSNVPADISGPLATITDYFLQSGPVPYVAVNVGLWE